MVERSACEALILITRTGGKGCKRRKKKSFSSFWWYWVWNQGLVLARQAICNLSQVSHPTSPFFALVILLIGSCGFGLASLRLQVSCVAGITVAHHHAWLEMRVSLTFGLGWPWTMILLISASWVAGIIDKYHHARPQKIILVLNEVTVSKNIKNSL
jgi:hypothetical protein